MIVKTIVALSEVMFEAFANTHVRPLSLFAPAVIPVAEAVTLNFPFAVPIPS